MFDVSRIPEGNPVNIPLRKTAKHRPNKLYRRLLPFYMKPAILIAFMVLSLMGQLTWTTASDGAVLGLPWGLLSAIFKADG